MSPSTLLRTTGLLIALSLPLSANALVIKNFQKPSHVQLDIMKYSSSKPSNILASSKSSAPSLVTIRSKDTGMVFKMPDNWKPLYDRDGVSFRMDRGQAMPFQTSFISVTRKKLSKPQTLKVLYKSILDKATIDAAGTNLGGPDFYIPSFKLTGSGTIKVLGIDALSMSYTGESRSNQYAYRRVGFMKDGWLYTILLTTPPAYLAIDEKAFEGVVGSLGIK